MHLQNISFTLKNKNFLLITFFKRRLYSFINLDLLPVFFHIRQNIHFTKIFLKNKNFYIKILNFLFTCFINFYFLNRSYGRFFLVIL